MPSEGWPRQVKNSPIQLSPAGGETVAHENVAQYCRYSMFRDLPPYCISNIVKLSNQKSFSRLQQVLVGAESCQQVALLTSGIVKVVQCNDAGKPTILKLAGPGELVGTIGLSVSHNTMCSCAFGLTPFTALIWKKKVFDSLLEQYPALGRNITNLLVRELNAMEDRFCELSLDEAATRLSRQMIRVLTQMGNPTDEGVDICISRLEIAQLIGANFYTVSRLLADWTRKGILQRRRDVLTVKNLQALIELSRNAVRSAD